MSKINILSESVYNKIAAGEVVEKPASVVKELLDNSIDAGATNIKISIEDGGIKNITVEDNGCGIEPDDFDKVFISHSTSKIKTEADLEKIGTLGFRGEALASIASISKVTLTSKVETETFARTCEIVGGKQGETTEIGANNGTTISVSDIFFNVPARAKFLKKPKSEASEITNLVERYILCNPSISFKYVVDGKEVLLSTGSNLFDAIFVVYGKATTDGIIKVDYQNPKSDIKVSGYIGLPTFSKPNRTYQTLSINGRYISSQLVSSCIYNAYEHYLMKGQFPFYVLNLEIPFEKLDVNVHPNKMEVRFNNSNEIYGNVYNAVSTALYNCDKITSPTDSITQPKEVKFGTSFSLHSTENTDENNTMQTKTVQIEIENKNEFKNVFDDFQVDKKTFSDNKQVDNLDTYKLSKSFEKIDFSTGVISEPSNSILNKIKNNSFEQTMLNEIDSQSQKTKTQEFFENADVKFWFVCESLGFEGELVISKSGEFYFINFPLVTINNVIYFSLVSVSTDAEPYHIKMIPIFTIS